MKTTELMIGDWVGLDCAIPHFEDKEVRIEQGIMPCQVVKFDDYQVVVKRPDKQFQVVLYDAISPIPLTAEILEKNGYHYEETCGIKQLYSEDGRVSFTSDPNYLNSQNVWSMHIDSEDMSTIGSVELTYVHEFQHMLRLCGIDKDINL